MILTGRSLLLLLTYSISFDGRAPTTLPDDSSITSNSDRRLSHLAACPFEKQTHLGDTCATTCSTSFPLLACKPLSKKIRYNFFLLSQGRDVGFETERLCGTVAAGQLHLYNFIARSIPIATAPSMESTITTSSRFSCGRRRSRNQSIIWQTDRWARNGTNSSGFAQPANSA